MTNPSFNDDARIKGDTDGTLIGNVNDSLKVAIVYDVGGVTGERLLGAMGRFSEDGDLVTFDMNVSATSGSPQDFFINPIAGKDLIITSILIIGIDNGIKLSNFLGLNSALTNGVEISFKSDDVANSFDTIFSTADLHVFASLGGFDLLVEAGGDEAKTTRTITPALPLRATGTFGPLAGDDDFLRIRIQDNLSTVDRFHAYARGVITGPGEL